MLSLRELLRWQAVGSWCLLFGGLAAAVQAAQGNGSDELVFGAIAAACLPAGVGLVLLGAPESPPINFAFVAFIVTTGTLYESDHLLPWWAESLTAWTAGGLVYVARRYLSARTPRTVES